MSSRKRRVRTEEGRDKGRKNIKKKQKENEPPPL